MLGVFLSAISLELSGFGTTPVDRASRPVEQSDFP